MFMDIRNGEMIPKDVAVNNRNHEITPMELASVLFNAKKYEVLDVINRCEDGKFALGFLKELQFSQEDKSFRMLLHVIKNKCKNKFCEDKKSNLTNEECIDEIVDILIQKLADLRASGEITLYKKVNQT